MKVADSSYIVEGLIKRKALLKEEFLVTLDLAVHEVANSIWKHECLLKDLDDGFPYLAILEGLIESGKIQIVSPAVKLMKRTYSLASKNRRSIYDTIYVALALELGLELATCDKHQADLFRKETSN